jgi:hypothetical protein
LLQDTRHIFLLQPCIADVTQSGAQDGDIAGTDRQTYR